jgi:hypothetical protein
MKNLRLVFSIVVILALVCSPVLAISKADLISQYKGQSSPAIPIPTPTQTPIVTPTPTSQLPSWFFPYPSVLPWNDSSFFRPSTDGKAKILDDMRAEYDGGNPLKPDADTDFSDSTLIYKPNIYLYCNRDLTARVRLAPEEDITVSEPMYRPGIGWWAQIRNGSLNGNGDFLFYEALVPVAGWQKQEGYIIHAAYREQDMASMLGHFGFNEKETGEFIDYWSQHLVEGVDFVFYPQGTQAVDHIMPLSVIPEPDHVSRIWFYAEPLVSVPEPVTSPEMIVREGFYVVEWGVMIG